MKSMPELTSRGSQVQANTVLELRSSFCSVGSVQGNRSAIFLKCWMGAVMESVCRLGQMLFVPLSQNECCVGTG